MQFNNGIVTITTTYPPRRPPTPPPLRDEHIMALRAGNPLAFGFLESCSTSETGPDLHCLNRTMTSELHVGRGPQNDLILPDPHISWSHCKIAYTEHQNARITVDITAKRTTNGTFVNGLRLRAGGTRRLVSGDTISFGVFKKPLPKNRLWDWLHPDETLEGSGLDAERLKFRRARWQFKLHLFGPEQDARLNNAARVVRKAWEGIFHCNQSISAARYVLSRLRDVEHSTMRVASTEGDEPPGRSKTPSFSPPPDEYDTSGRDINVNYYNGDKYFRLVKDPEALSWYHPDIIWLGEVRHKPDPLCYELPSSFKYWSSVYGIPQGLHPRWTEFSSAVYGDDCPDVGPESVLLQGVPAMPTWLTAQFPDYETRREGDERAAFDSLARQTEIARLYREGRHERQTNSSQLPANNVAAGQPTTQTQPSLAAPPASLAPSSKKRKQGADDDAHSPPLPTTHNSLTEPVPKRAKRDAQKKREIPSGDQAASQRVRSATSTSARHTATSADDHRAYKRSRPEDEESLQERPVKRLARGTVIAPSTAAEAPSRVLKRRRPEPNLEEAAREPLATHSRSNAAPSHPTIPVTTVRSRKRLRPERSDSDAATVVQADRALTPPVRRITRATSQAPIANEVNAERPMKRRRQVAATGLTPLEALEAEDSNTRRSTRLRAKTPARYR